jgi:hypothetical protein
MHLTDRSGGDRLLGELEEQALDWLTELLAHDLLDVFEGKRADLVLELSQLDDDVRRRTQALKAIGADEVGDQTQILWAVQGRLPQGAHGGGNAHGNQLTFLGLPHRVRPLRRAALSTCRPRPPHKGIGSR